MIQEPPPLITQGAAEAGSAEGKNEGSYGWYKATVAFCQFFHIDGRVSVADLCVFCVREIAANVRP